MDILVDYRYWVIVEETVAYKQGKRCNKLTNLTTLVEVTAVDLELSIYFYLLSSNCII